MALRQSLMLLGLVLLPSPMYAPALPAAARAVTREAYTQARTYAISPALSQAILSAAVAEHIPVGIAYRLVRKESGFRVRALGRAGEIGLLQVKLSTAQLFDSTMTARRLFQPHTNLRVGFRYAARMHRRYGGDWTRALTAFNRGPGVVDTLQAPREGMEYANSIHIPQTPARRAAARPAPQPSAPSGSPSNSPETP
jgi:soluble lytic murein transglycosylase-like protein